jgi:photosystem II stability/assembly factor-like uncharacterized protein
MTKLDWIQAEGSEGTSISSIAIVETSDQPLALAAATSGLLISKDHCQSWIKVSGALEGMPILAVNLTPSFSHSPLAILGTSGGIACSQDLSTWTPAHLPQEGINVISLTASPNFVNEGLLIAGTLDYGVLCSNDRGRSWQKHHFGLQDLCVLSMAISPNFARDELILAGTSTGIFRSPNGGLAWREAIVPNEDDPILSLSFSPNYAIDHLVLAGTEEGRILQSIDDGRNWIHRETPCEGSPINAIRWVSDLMGWHLFIGSGNKVFMRAESQADWDILDTGDNILCLSGGTGSEGLQYLVAGLENEGVLKWTYHF